MEVGSLALVDFCRIFGSSWFQSFNVFGLKLSLKVSVRACGIWNCWLCSLRCFLLFWLMSEMGMFAYIHWVLYAVGWVYFPVCVVSVVSSLIRELTLISSISFMCRLNSTGPNTVPCGTPDSTSDHLDFVLFTTTHCLR